MTEIDLTPFGFTPTENRAYRALLELGPSSGYALAKALSIARANAYQALNGLVAKRGAVRTNEEPQRYRAERPDAMLARIVDAESRKLDALERQVAAVGNRPGSPVVPIEGRRGLVNTALRTVARAPEVTLVGPEDLVTALGPAWRRRSAENMPSVVWVVGGGEETAANLPVAVAGLVDPGRINEYFGSGVFVLLASDVAMVARVGNGDVSGYWTTDKTLVGVVRAATAALTVDMV